MRLYVTGNNRPNGVSSFTTGEVAALDKAFQGEGTDPDVTAVIREARGIEPTYDVAAEPGLTSPSPEPNSAGASCGPPPDTPDAFPPDGWSTSA